MRSLSIPRTILLGGLLTACTGDDPAVTTTATDETGETGGVSNSDTGVDASPTTGGAPDTTGSGGADETSSSISSSDTGSTGTDSTGAVDDTGTDTTGTDTTGGGPACGDGVLDAGEQCDDGNDVDDDGCLTTCVFGPGGLVEVIDLDPLTNMDSEQKCFTAIDQSHLDGDQHALVFGADIVTNDPEPQISARLQQLRLPALVDPAWTFLEAAGQNARRVHQVATAADGDIVVAGDIYLELNAPDAGAHLWLARLSPDGATVWSHEFPTIGSRAAGLEIAADGDIMLAGAYVTLGGLTSEAMRFTGTGELLWNHPGPKANAVSSSYSGVALDDDGTVYLAGQHTNQGQRRVLLQAREPDGTLLWEALHEPPDDVRVSPGDVVWRADDTLVVAVTRLSADETVLLDELALAAFDADDGALLWWKSWGPGAAPGVSARTLVTAEDDGFHLFAQTRDGDSFAAVVARFTADGEPVWTHVTPDQQARQGLRGPDDRLYTLTATSVLINLP